MNDHDRNNLNFLLNASPETLRDWFNQVDEDDVRYASELLDAYSREIDIQQQEVDIEFELIAMDKYTEAQLVLAQFRL